MHRCVISFLDFMSCGSWLWLLRPRCSDRSPVVIQLHVFSHGITGQPPDLGLFLPSVLLGAYTQVFSSATSPTLTASLNGFLPYILYRTDEDPQSTVNCGPWICSSISCSALVLQSPKHSSCRIPSCCHRYTRLLRSAFIP